MIPKIAYNKKLFAEKPFLEEIFKMCTVCAKKFFYKEYYKYKDKLLKFYLNLEEQGVSMDKINAELWGIINNSRNYTEWYNNMEGKERRDVVGEII
jgi:hypothetical protein